MNSGINSLMDSRNMPVLDRKKKWRLANPEKVRANMDRYIQKNPEYSRIYRERKRREVLEFFGGECVHCSNSDWRVLQVDHVNGNGGAMRKKFKSVHQVWAEAMRDSENHQLLCANCNWIKRYENNEVRNGSKDEAK